MPLTNLGKLDLTMSFFCYILFIPMRGRAVVARRAHNPEVSRSNRLPATEKEPGYAILWFFVSRAYSGCTHFRIGGFKNKPAFTGLKNRTHFNFAFKSYRWLPYFQAC